MKKLAMTALVIGMCCSVTPGGPLKTEQVSGEAIWVAHLDAAALLKSQVGKFILSEIEKKEGFVDGIGKVRETLGFDPLADVRGVTLYGKAIGDDSAVVIIDVTADQKKVLALLEGNATYKATEYGERTLHEWRDDAKTKTDPATGEQVVVKPAKQQFGAFYDAATVIVASSMDLLKGAVDVLDGKAKSLAKSGAIKTLPKPAEGVFLTVAAEHIKFPAKADKPQAAPFRHITDLSAQLGEAKQAVFLHATALTTTAEKAMKLRQVVQGFVALGQMMLAEREDLPALGEKVQVGGTENTVQVDADVPTDSLIKMFQHLVERKKRMGERMKARGAKTAGQ